MQYFKILKKWNFINKNKIKTFIALFRIAMMWIAMNKALVFLFMKYKNEGNKFS